MVAKFIVLNKQATSRQSVLTQQYLDISLTTVQYLDIALTTVQYLDIALTTVQYLQRFSERTCTGLDKVHSISKQDKQQPPQGRHLCNIA